MTQRKAVCPISSSHEKLKYLFDKNNTSIYRCKNCGLYVANIEWDQAQYEEDSYYTMTYGSVNKILEEWGFRWNYILTKLAIFVPPPATIVDVGAGNGSFVFLSEKAGYKAEGLELSQKQIDFAKSHLNVHLQKEFLDSFSKYNYDIVTAFNVIEHVPAPKQFLYSLREHARRSGFVCITTPNTSSFKRLFWGARRWEMIDPPHHLNLFTRKALFEIIEDCGLKIVCYEYLSTYLRPLRKFGPLARLVKPLVFDLLRLTHLAADHMIIAQRID